MDVFETILLLAGDDDDVNLEDDEDTDDGADPPTAAIIRLKTLIECDVVVELVNGYGLFCEVKTVSINGISTW